MIAHTIPGVVSLGTRVVEHELDLSFTLGKPREEAGEVVLPFTVWCRRP